jgi:Na+/H+ antiporter NhaA
VLTWVGFISSLSFAFDISVVTLVLLLLLTRIQMSNRISTYLYIYIPVVCLSKPCTSGVWTTYCGDIVMFIICVMGQNTYFKSSFYIFIFSHYSVIHIFSSTHICTYFNTIYTSNATKYSFPLREFSILILLVYSRYNRLWACAGLLPAVVTHKPC